MILSKTYTSFKNALNGLKTVWMEERNFKIEIACAVLVIVAGILLRFSILEFIFSVLAIFLVIIAEIVNTAVEDICNKIQPAYDSDIKKIKDTMAAVVLLSVIAAGIIGFILFYPYVMYFLFGGM